MHHCCSALYFFFLSAADDAAAAAQAEAHRLAAEARKVDGYRAQLGRAFAADAGIEAAAFSAAGGAPGSSARPAAIPSNIPSPSALVVDHLSSPTRDLPQVVAGDDIEAMLPQFRPVRTSLPVHVGYLLFYSYKLLVGEMLWSGFLILRCFPF